MDQYPRVRRKAVWASGEAAFHTAVSRSALDTVEHFTGPSAKLRVIPNGVDGTIFTPLPEGRQPDPSQIVYVGRIHRVKGVDVLLRAMRRLIDQRPHLRLVLVGGGFPYRGYQIEEESLRALAADLGLGWRVEFTGGQPPGEVARIMRESAVLVLPSRAESFGSVLVEALACGTPVVATRCGGPEDIVTDEVGVMVPPEDDEALAGAFAHVLDHRSEYPPRRLRAYALERFSWERVAGLTSELYREALRKRR
jgi:glycosyltransferase involved in cell wall biosynthesis